MAQAGFSIGVLLDVFCVHQHGTGHRGAVRGKLVAIAHRAGCADSPVVEPTGNTSSEWENP
jgi:hypothetical protein